MQHNDCSHTQILSRNTVYFCSSVHKYIKASVRGKSKRNDDIIICALLHEYHSAAVYILTWLSKVQKLEFSIGLPFHRTPPLKWPHFNEKRVRNVCGCVVQLPLYVSLSICVFTQGSAGKKGIQGQAGSPGIEVSITKYMAQTERK